MNTPELQALWKALDELNAQAYAVPASSFEEYQKRLGIWQGLNQAINILTGFQDDDVD